MFIVLVGLNHKTAPVEVREWFSLTETSLQKALKELKEFSEIEGCVILSTCNRFEIYCAVNDIEPGVAKVKEFITNHLVNQRDDSQLQNIEKYLYLFTCHDSINHLFRVVAGLDSMIIGETQVLGQVKEAYEKARSLGVTNGVINTLFQQAIAVGKRVRTETSIDGKAVSISYAAVELAKQIFGSLEGHTVLVIGAGETGELAARYLVDNGVSSVIVSNRSFARAEELARLFGGQAERFENLENSLSKADIVISCTAACHYVLHLDLIQKIMQDRQERPLFIIDIAVPRDVDPEVGNVKNVRLYDIDDLQNVVDTNLLQRRLEGVKAERIIKEELIEFNNWLNSLFVVPTIIALKEKAETIKRNELTRAFNRLGNVTQRQEKVIISLANSIVNQLLHDPVIQLKEFAATQKGHLYTEVIQNLFRLEVDEEIQSNAKKTKATADGYRQY